MHVAWNIFYNINSKNKWDEAILKYILVVLGNLLVQQQVWDKIAATWASLKRSQFSVKHSWCSHFTASSSHEGNTGGHVGQIQPWCYMFICLLWLIGWWFLAAYGHIGERTAVITGILSDLSFTQNRYIRITEEILNAGQSLCFGIKYASFS